MQIEAFEISQFLFINPWVKATKYMFLEIFLKVKTYNGHFSPHRILTMREKL